MSTKYLDETGLTRFWNNVKQFFTGTATPTMNSGSTGTVGTSTKFAREDHIHPKDSSKVDVVSGKGLSTEDYTTAEKTKLSGIATGAEVNQNAFSKVTVGSTTIEADAKTDILILEAGSNVTLTPSNTSGNAKVAISATDTTYSLVGTQNTTGLVKNGSNVTSTSGLTASPMINGVVYYKNTTYTAASATPLVDSGNGGVGSSAKYAREDHYHPTDTTRAPLTSPAFTGNPTAPTAGVGTSTTQIATCQFVVAEVAARMSGYARFSGTLNDPTELSTRPSYSSGEYWIVQTAGTYAGQVCEVGDMIWCVHGKDPTGYKDSDFAVVQSNLDIGTISTTFIDNLFSAVS